MDTNTLKEHAFRTKEQERDMDKIQGTGKRTANELPRNIL